MLLPGSQNGVACFPQVGADCATQKAIDVIHEDPQSWWPAPVRRHGVQFHGQRNPAAQQGGAA
jgi:hypothetical protein